MKRKPLLAALACLALARPPLAKRAVVVELAVELLAGL